MSLQDEEKEPLSGAAASDVATGRKLSAPVILLASGLGTFLEFYSFGLIAYFESSIADAFFPSSSSSYISLLEAFSLYGVAFVARPFGGMLFGFIADKFSRITSLRASIVCMSVPTFLIGCTPTYDSIGWGAPVIVFILRTLQGLSAGGEFSTAVVYISERCNDPRNDSHNSSTNRSMVDRFMSYFEHDGLNTGLYVGAVTIFAMGDFVALLFYDILDTAMNDSELDSWGWRIPFWASILISLFAIYIRSVLDESNEFSSISEEEIESSTPVYDVFTLYWKQVIFLSFINIGPFINYYVVLTFLPIYLDSDIHYGTKDGYSYYIAVVCYISYAMGMVYSGCVSDRKGYYKTSIVTVYVILVAYLIGFWLIDFTDNVVVESICQILLVVLSSFTLPPLTTFAVTYIEDVRVRSTMFGLCFNLSAALIMSSIFDVCTALADLNSRWGGAYVGLYMFGLNLLGLIGLKWCHNNPWKTKHIYDKLENKDEANNDLEIDSQSTNTVQGS